MSETNNRYTFHYSQPEEYRFSLDSVFLAQKVAKILEQKNDLEEKSFLDLCSGCGVIGLELAIHLESNLKIDFMEVQSVYKEHFHKNTQALFPNNFSMKFLNFNYENVLDNEDYKDQYDVILSNPPYFFQGEGLYSPSEFKNRCRFFMDSSFEKLIEAILYMLRPGGHAYVLIRDGKHHGRTLVEEVSKIAENRAQVTIIDNVRGTNVVEIVSYAR